MHVCMNVCMHVETNKPWVPLFIIPSRKGVNGVAFVLNGVVAGLFLLFPCLFLLLLKVHYMCKKLCVCVLAVTI